MKENKFELKVFSKETVFMIGVQIFERLRDLHSIGVIHNDLKPDNFLIDSHTGSTLHLIDFGLSNFFITDEDPIIDPQTGKHFRKHKPRV